MNDIFLKEKDSVIRQLFGFSSNIENFPWFTNKMIDEFLIFAGRFNLRFEKDILGI